MKMNKRQFLNIFKFEGLIDREAVLSLIFLAFLIYLAIGIFPFVPVEGDGIGIANGATQAAAYGLGPQPLAYRYGAQSGTYALIVMVHKLTGLDTFAAFSWLSAFSSILFILGAAALLKRLTQYPYAHCGLAILLFQETFTGGYYPNSTVIAAAFGILALYISTFEPRFYGLALAGVLLGVGIWTRFDLVLIAPTVLLFLYRGNWKQALFQSVVVAFITIVVSLSALYYSGSDLTTIFASVDSHMAASSEGTPGLGIPGLGSPDMKSYLSIYSGVVLFLALSGVFFLIHRKNWYLLGILLLGMGPFHLVYSGRIESPKYMYYLIPFLGIAVVSGWFAGIKLPSRPKRIAFASILTALFVFQYLIGVQVSFTSKPYIKPAYPILLSLANIQVPLPMIDQVSVVVGAGTKITTSDGARLSSGILFAPISYSQNKSYARSEIRNISSFIATSKDNPLDLLTTQYNAKQLILYLLLERGYECQIGSESPEQRLNKYICTKADQVVTLTDQRYVALTSGGTRSYRNIKRAMSLVKSCEVVFLTTTMWELDLFLKNAKDWVKISDFAYRINHCLVSNSQEP